MKALLLLLFLKMASTEEEVSGRLNDYIYKYQYDNRGNPELITWIERLQRVGKTAGDEVKRLTLRDFQAYDRLRMDLEEQILVRINELESLFPDRRLSEACVDEYLDQKSALIIYKKMSNKEKMEALRKNSVKCTRVDTTTQPTPTKPTLISTSTEPGVNATLITPSTDPGVDMTLTSTTTAPLASGVNMTLISTSTEPAVTVTLTGTNREHGETITNPGETITDSRKTSTDPGETSTDPGETSNDSGETSTNPGEATKDSGETSTDPGETSTTADSGTTMTSMTTSPGVLMIPPITIKSPYVPIMNHC